MNTNDNVRTKKHGNLRGAEIASSSNTPSEPAPSSSRTTASKLSPIDLLTIKIKNKLGMNISTEETSRIINSIYAEKGSEQTAKSLTKALDRKKSQRPDLNIGAQVALAQSKKAERILNDGIEEQESRLLDEISTLDNYEDIKNELFREIIDGMGLKAWRAAELAVSRKHIAKFGHTIDDLTRQYKRVEAVLKREEECYDRVVEQMKSSDGQTLSDLKEKESYMSQYISTLTSDLDEKYQKYRVMYSDLKYHTIQYAKELKNKVPKESRAAIERYERLFNERPSMPRMIETREQGIARLREQKEIVTTVVDNCEDIILMTKVCDALTVANNTLESIKEKNDELTDKINRDMQDAKIKQDAINAIVASVEKKKKDTDVEEQSIVFPLVPGHTPEASRNIDSEETPRHKLKSKREPLMMVSSN